MRRKQVGGLLLGFGGAVGLMSLKDAAGEVHWWAAAAMVVLATACYGLSINVVRNRLSAVDPVTISAVALSMTAIAICGRAFSAGGLGVLNQHPEGDTLSSRSILACVGTAAALILFNALIQRTNALFASSVTYVIPLFALFWGWWDGEWIGWPHAAYSGRSF